MLFFRYIKHLNPAFVVIFLVIWPVLLVPGLIFGGHVKPITSVPALIYLSVLWGLLSSVFISPFFSIKMRALILNKQSSLSDAKPLLIFISGIFGVFNLSYLYELFLLI